jgi:ketosteroid isomerase-like protein
LKHQVMTARDSVGGRSALVEDTMAQGHGGSQSAISRRNALASLGVGGAAVAVAMTVGSQASAGAAAREVLPDTASNGSVPAAAPPEIQHLFAEYFAAKSAHDVKATMSFFSRDMIEYADGTLGWTFPSWSALEALFQQYMPAWPAAARSYSTEILGSDSGVIVRFTNTPEEFGHEIRGIAVVDIRHGKFVRWVDYWDGRHFGVDAAAQLRTPAASFPATFGEAQVGEYASGQASRVISAFATALANGDVATAAAGLTDDVVLTDLALHAEVIGHQSVSGYLTRAVSQLPYGVGSKVRHIVGGVPGGGYEWTNPTGPVPRGVSAVQLTEAGLISRITAMWDGSLVTPAWITSRTAIAIES